ncbi:MAG: cytochrome b5 domain-containing protein, partial [Anaerolineae bacterium]|nr:cytochrome b5 domain-containing protein [Anaerolineae bacterium]
KTVPAREVLNEAERINQQQGHENLGYLSASAGFLPLHPPLLQMPESHAAWDEMAENLPYLHKTLELRRVLDAMPYLSGTVQAVPDKYLLRASSLLGVFAHAYHHIQIDPAPLPANIMQPWTEVSRRLNKAKPYLSYVDLILNNWKLRDSNIKNPRTVENMDLLFPTVGNETERAFYMGQVEVAAGFTSIMNAVIRAQEAVVNDDNTGLETELIRIIENLQYLSSTIYQKIDPNPYSKTYIDQVIWAKTVAPFAVPISEGVPSPSGTAIAHFHMMDAFLPRTRYQSQLGKQAVSLAEHAPLHTRNFVEAVKQVSVPEYIEKTGNQVLRGLYNSLVDTYASDKGFLGVHRLKAYGFLEVAFKVGRSVTTGAKFTGLFKDRTWDKIDVELALTRDERYLHGNQYVDAVKPTSGSISTDPQTGQWINFIAFDITEKGIYYQPGDRVGVLVENSDFLIQETLHALQAAGDEEVALTQQWQEALRLRPEYTGEEKTLPLRTILKFGKIRPVTREIGKRLFALSANETLRRVLNARMEDQWELWDLLNILYVGRFDTRRLWKASPWEAESICRVVRPEVFRLYSIASAMQPDSKEETLHLTVGGLEYETPQTPYSFNEKRAGTASSFLRRISTSTNDEDGTSKQVGIAIIPTMRFHLPRDPQRPIVMFAAGSGIAPFWGFLQARTQQADSGENWLFFGTRTAKQIYYKEAFEQMEARQELNLRVAFSGEDVALRFENSRYVLEEGQRQRIDKLMQMPANAQALWDLMRSPEEGGKGAYLYVCGRTGFAVSVMNAIKDVMMQFNGNDPNLADEMLRVMVAEGRFMQDIFTTYTGNTQDSKQYNISELILHNNPKAGYWMTISGKVYDISDFMFLHAGGERIMANNAGLDATQPYQTVLHHVNSEVDALLGMYELGSMRRMNFDSVWGIGLNEDGLHFVTLENVFKQWVRYLYLVVGMENALYNDYDFATLESTYQEDPQELTPFKIQFLIESHRRFLVSYLDGLIDEDLQNIWWVTLGLCDIHQDIRWLQDQMGIITRSDSYKLVRGANRVMKDRLYQLQNESDEKRYQQSFVQLSHFCGVCADADLKVMYNLKVMLREGIILFEKHEAQVVENASDDLMRVLKSVPVLVQEYYKQLAIELELLGLSLANISSDELDESIPDGAAFPGHGGTQA